MPLETFCVGRDCNDWLGYRVLIFGPLGMLVSSTNWTWVANPVLFMAWAAHLIGAKLLSAVLSLAALVIATSFLFQREIMTNEGGVLVPITGYRSGYWIWLASMMISLLGSLGAIALTSKRKRDAGF